MLIDDHVAHMLRDAGRVTAAEDAGRSMLPVLAEAMVYDVSDEVVELANALTYGDLPGLARVREMARPPHPVTWFEYSSLARRRWLELRGNPVSPVDEWPRRTGILVREEGAVVRFENVNRFKGGADEIEPVGLWIDYARSGPRPTSRWPIDFQANKDMDAAEVTAYATITDAMAAGYSAYAGWHDARQVSGPGAEGAKAAWFGDLMPEVVVGLGLCLLLAVPDMVETEPSDLARLNRALARGGKPTKRDYATIRVARGFRREARLLVDSLDRRPGAVRPHIVRGHFKRIPKGLTWWNSHVRSRAPDGDEDELVKVRQLRR